MDKQQHVRDLQSNHKGEMLHMFSLLVGRSRTSAPELPFTGQLRLLFAKVFRCYCCEEQPCCSCWFNSDSSLHLLLSPR